MEETHGATEQRLIERFGRRFESGEVLFREGEPGAEAFLLQEGKVRLVKRVRSAERSLAVLKSGDLFGESALIPGASRSSTAVALTEGLALALAEGTFRTLVQSNAPIATRVLMQLVRRVRDLEEQIELMMIRDGQSKVITALLKIAATQSTSVISVSPADLASRVGLDVDSVKRAVQQLREREYLRIANDKLEIVDADALEKLLALLAVKDEIAGGAR